MTPRDLLEGVEGRIVIALSGGPDSAAAAALVSEAGFPVRCIHVDHGLAGSASLRAAATAIAAALGLDLEIAEIVPRSESETALRDARYAALLDRLEPGETLVTAHTADDQVETVLINLLRGTGPAGLAGIPPIRGSVMRPFLDITAAELREVAVERGLPFVDDPENQSTAHLRNRIRTELVPLLEREFQPALRATLSRTARNMADAASTLGRTVSRVPMERARNGIRASMGRLAAVDPATRRQAIRAMLTAIRPPLAPTEAEVTRVERVRAGEIAQTDLEGVDATAFVSGPWLYVASAPEIPGGTPLVDGTVWGQFRFSFAEPGAIRLSRWRFVTRDTSLRLRPAAVGDVIAMRDGSKSVTEAIGERGLRPEGHPVVVDGAGRIVWIPGVRHAWQPTSETRGRVSGYLEIIANQESPWAPFEP